MKNYKTRMTVLLSVLLLLSCEKNDETSLSCDADTIEFSDAGGSKPLRVESDGDWSIYGSADWLVCSATSGIKTQDIALTTLQNKTGKDRTVELTIRTNDGQNVRAVKVVQYANAEGRLLMVDDVSKKYFNGTSTFTYEDSIIISSSVRWTIKGPAWLSASLNNKVLPMNDELHEGSGVVYLRGSSSYSGADAREDVVTLKSEAGDVTITIPVEQLGKEDIKCVGKVVVTEGLACRFKYGSGVTKFKYKLFTGTASADELTFDNTTQWASASMTATVFYRSQVKLEPATEYVLYTRGLNLTKVNQEVFQTPSADNQPRAVIADVRKETDGWTVGVTMNSLTGGYYFAHAPSNWYDMGVGYIAYKFYSSISKGSINLQVTNARYKVTTNDDVTLVVWPVGKDGTLSGVLELYKATVDAAETPMAARPVIQLVGTLDVQESLEDQLSSNHITFMKN